MKPSGPMPTKSSVRASRRKATSSRSSASAHSRMSPSSCLVRSSIVASPLRCVRFRIAESSAPCGFRSVHDPASRQVERHPGYPGGALGGEEQGGERDVFRRTQPAERYLLSHLQPPLLRNHPAGAFDEHGVRGQAVDPHAAGRDLPRDVSGEHHHPRLGGRVRSGRARRDAGRARCHGYDGAASALCHAGQEGLEGQEGGGEAAVDSRLPVLLGSLRKRSGTRPAPADERRHDPDRPELLLRPPSHALDGGEVGAVGRCTHRLAPGGSDLSHHGVDLRLVAAVPHPLSFFSTYNTKSTILFRWATPQSRTVLGAMEGFRLLEVLCDSTWRISQGALGNRGGAISLALLKEPLVAFSSSFCLPLPSFSFCFCGFLGVR